MKIIDGRKIAEQIISEIKEQVKLLSFQPVFCDVLVGKDPASAQYVRMKEVKAESIGIKVHRAEFSESITTAELIEEIKKLNHIPNISGLIVQLPLPQHLHKQQVLNAVDPAIDVDVTGQVNSDKFYDGVSGAMCFPTAAAVLEILKATGKNLINKNFLVVGQGQLVGRPISYLLGKMGYTYFAADKKTQDMQKLLKQADVVISAAGQPGVITGKNLKPDCVVIDAGTSESEGGIVGDVDFDSVKQVASFISPVPGGVGPVTVAMLLKNVLMVAETKNKI